MCLRYRDGPACYGPVLASCDLAVVGGVQGIVVGASGAAEECVAEGVQDGETGEVGGGWSVGGQGWRGGGEEDSDEVWDVGGVDASWLVEAHQLGVGNERGW